MTTPSHFTDREPPLVVAAGEGNELEAQPSGSSVDAAFILRLTESKCTSPYQLCQLNIRAIQPLV
ncbi:hypothetical protein PDIG_78910 [Penicillium digitatum PHI26]|uniref:Uncharacterized protein n=2 Tax=Penicillium digitatum TaxID=36651 RepID=K9FTJ2_PEND2|nr:hypothetical protein PDIP_27320 [Penicillium digitatum Pd1]EKV06113.1 hypothetical protein PDIG_78910 [Penicillium digitatum PHI26]EKV18465.1 hypothetical protein PDIP_27320 [Penicillium digitatum Pd1]